MIGLSIASVTPIGKPTADAPSGGRFGATVAGPITVAVIADDVISADGVVAGLRMVPGVQYLSADRLNEADVVVVVAFELTEPLLAKLKSLHENAVNPDQCLVLVADVPDERTMARVFTYGAVSILPRRGVTRESIVRAVVASGSGSAMLPGPVARWIVDHSRTYEHVVRTSHGILAGGLTAREVEVVRLLAEGMSTTEIAIRLAYAERTIKNIVRDLLVRLGVRNRTQAVAYAFRVGAI